MKSDRRLDESVHWDLEDLLAKLKLGTDWATQVIQTVPIEILRETEDAYTLTPFWRHVMQVIPRGAWIYSRDVYGGTEGGSSGSPIYNAQGQVVGQLTGACGTNTGDACDSGSNARRASW